MFRIEYRTHNEFDNCMFADDSEQAYVKAQKLAKLRHVSNVRVVHINQPGLFEDRFMYCPQCNFACRFSQLPVGFVLDTDEPDNPFVWCEHFRDRKSCSYRQSTLAVQPARPHA